MSENGSLTDIAFDTGVISQNAKVLQFLNSKIREYTELAKQSTGGLAFSYQKKAEHIAEVAEEIAEMYPPRKQECSCDPCDNKDCECRRAKCETCRAEEN